MSYNFTILALLPLGDTPLLPNTTQLTPEYPEIYGLKPNNPTFWPKYATLRKSRPEIASIWHIYVQINGILAYPSRFSGRLASFRHRMA